MFLECATSSGWFSRFYEFIRHGNLEIVATWLVSSFFGGKKKEKTSLYIYIYIKEVCKECLNFHGFLSVNLHYQSCQPVKR